MEERKEISQNTLKILMLGDSNTGKSTIISTFDQVDTTNPGKVITTKKIDRLDTQYEITERPGDNAPTGGIPFGPYNAVVIVCDLTNKESITNGIEKWNEHLKDLIRLGSIDVDQSVKLYAIGNKKNRLDHLVQENHQAFIHACDIRKIIPFEIIDATNQQSVESCFQGIALHIVKKIESDQYMKSELVLLRSAYQLAYDKEILGRSSTIPGIDKAFREKKPPNHAKQLRRRLEKLNNELLRQTQHSLQSLPAENLSSKEIKSLLDDAFKDCHDILKSAVNAKDKDNLISKVKWSLWKRDETRDMRYRELAKQFDSLANTKTVESKSTPTPEPLRKKS